VSDSLGCDPTTSRTWPCGRRLAGLSRQDDTLLRGYLRGLGTVPAELHTHVPVGALPGEPEGVVTERDRAMVEALWPRRIDCVLLVGGLWRLLEVKPVADHHALGQVLCYGFWWRQVKRFPGLDELGVVTWRCDADCVAAYSHFGVRVFVVQGAGAVTYSGRRWVAVDDVMAEDYEPLRGTP